MPSLTGIFTRARFDVKDIPDLAGRVAIVTGGNTGIGRPTVAQLARKGARVYLAARSTSRAEEAIKAIKAETPTVDVVHLQLDLSDLDSVKKAAEEFLSKEKELHLLINNAGIMATPYSETPQGYEIQFGTNYIGHYLFTSLLLPTLLTTATTAPRGSVRIVNVSSNGHDVFAPKAGIEFDNINLKDSGTWARYGQSKLANVLHAKSLADSVGAKGILTASVHPGAVNTELQRGPTASSSLYKPFAFILLAALTPDQGAISSLYAATSPAHGFDNNGEYYGPKATAAVPSALAQDAALRKKLWDWTEKEIARLGYA
ncbi:MAG: hypothetical protein M1839_002932 [Geoglossum umbratile]|nr:MAG: hypothetical protein M1839_002932 [Geoglossum umbratile]